MEIAEGKGFAKPMAYTSVLPTLALRQFIPQKMCGECRGEFGRYFDGFDPDARVTGGNGPCTKSAAELSIHLSTVYASGQLDTFRRSAREGEFRRVLAWVSLGVPRPLMPLRSVSW